MAKTPELSTAEREITEGVRLLMLVEYGSMAKRFIDREDRAGVRWEAWGQAHGRDCVGNRAQQFAYGYADAWFWDEFERLVLAMLILSGRLRADYAYAKRYGKCGHIDAFIEGRFISRFRFTDMKRKREERRAYRKIAMDSERTGPSASTDPAVRD